MGTKSTKGMRDTVELGKKDAGGKKGGGLTGNSDFKPWLLGKCIA